MASDGHLSKKALLAAALPTKVVEIPGKGTVLARGLSRAEVVDELRKVDRSVPGAFEAQLVAMGLVAPELTPDEVLAWRSTSGPFELAELVEEINALSGFSKDAAKAAWKEMESDPDAEFRDAAGAGTRDDGGAAEE